MKQIFFLLLLFSSALSCSNNKPAGAAEQEGEVNTPTTGEMENLKKMSITTEEMAAKTQALKKLTPLPPERLKALLPGELAGMRRTQFNAGNSMGYVAAEAEYKNNDKASLKLVVYDCAGEAGSGMYVLAYWGAMNVQQESDHEYTKTIEFKGGKAIENFRKDTKEAVLTYGANERLLVMLKGRNLDPAVLRAAAENLHFTL